MAVLSLSSCLTCFGAAFSTELNWRQRRNPVAAAFRRPKPISEPWVYAPNADKWVSGKKAAQLQPSRKIKQE